MMLKKAMVLLFVLSVSLPAWAENVASTMIPACIGGERAAIFNPISANSDHPAAVGLPPDRYRLIRNGNQIFIENLSHKCGRTVTPPGRYQVQAVWEMQTQYGVEVIATVTSDAVLHPGGLCRGTIQEQ